MANVKRKMLAFIAREPVTVFCDQYYPDDNLLSAKFSCTLKRSDHQLAHRRDGGWANENA